MPFRRTPLVEPVAGWLWPAGACVVVSLLLFVDRSSQPVVGLLAALLLGGALALREQALWKLCLTDALTGLPNRRAFQRGFEAALRDEPGPVALVLIDCDRFKRINDVHGHAAGDAALEALASALRGAVRTEDLVARWGGDEFVVLLRRADEAEVRKVAALVNAGLAPASTGVPFTVSFGCVVRGAAQARSARLSSLLSAADDALYRAKRRGGGQVAAWNEQPFSPFDFEQHTPPIRGS